VQVLRCRLPLLQWGLLSCWLSPKVPLPQQESPSGAAETATTLVASGAICRDRGLSNRGPAAAK
jgi:hypothetical protein